MDQTMVNNFLLLLLGKPGFYPSIPTIGIDIEQYLYTFIDDINIDDIKAKIAVQCSDFLPAIREGNFDIQKTIMKDRVLLVFVLPTISKKQSLLGVTTDGSGKVIFRFVEGKNQIL